MVKVKQHIANVVKEIPTVVGDNTGNSVVVTHRKQGDFCIMYTGIQKCLSSIASSILAFLSNNIIRVWERVDKNRSKHKKMRMGYI